MCQDRNVIKSGAEGGVENRMQAMVKFVWITF